MTDEDYARIVVSAWDEVDGRHGVGADDFEAFLAAFKEILRKRLRKAKLGTHSAPPDDDKLWAAVDAIRRARVS